MVIKICNRCGAEKPLSDYYLRENGKPQGGQCITCVKERVKLRSLQNENADYFTEKGVIRTIYKTQKRSNKIRGFGEIPYSKKDFSVWLYENDFKLLYDRWMACGCIKDMKPSVDRLDDLKGYSLDNIRLVTWKDNREHQYKDIITATGSSGKRCKSLLQLSKEKEIIKEHISYNAAQREMGYSIEYQIKHNVPCRNGFYWQYK